MKQIKETLARIEAQRRERTDPSLATVVAPGGIDYSGAGMLIQSSLAAIDEGIPNKQRTRVRLSLLAMLEGVQDLFAWAHYNGYFTEPAGMRAEYERQMDESVRDKAALTKALESTKRIKEALIELKSFGALNEAQEDLLAKALMEAPALTAEDLRGVPFGGSVTEGTEGPKGHIFGFMYQARATEFITRLQKEGIGSQLAYDAANDRHDVQVPPEHNAKSLEVYNQLVKDIASGA